MVSKLALVTLYLSAFALARPSHIRRQDEDQAPEVPEEETPAPEEPGKSSPCGVFRFLLTRSV